MLKGYSKIVRVDLTTGKISYEAVDEAFARKYIGGIGFAAKILWDETTADTDPLGPENRLIVMTGPLAGSVVPKSSRGIIAAISPATGLWGQSHLGGIMASELRHAGFDGIVVSGQSSRPVYLWVHNGQAEIRDAGHLWGKDTYEAADILWQETDPKACPVCIGRAGEKLVNMSGVISEGRRVGRAAPRCGLGAVMGSKKLKAFVIRGTLPLDYHDDKKMQEIVKEIYRLFPLPKKDEDIIEPKVEGFRALFVNGRVPIKNWSQASWEPGLVYATAIRGTKATHCRNCPYICTESWETPEGERHMTWEVWGPLGTNCLIADTEALQQAYTLLQKYGMDGMSVGAAVAFAMECFEKGLITRADTGGVELVWGNKEAMLEMVRQIGEREGFGALLGQGVRKAAEVIGGNAAEYAMHVKGMELPAHDPRAANGLALAYATGSIGAEHMKYSGGQVIENWLEVDNPRSSPELGFPAPMNRFETKGKGNLVARTQNWGCLLDSMTVCLFLSLHQWVQPSHYTALINGATGWDMTMEELLQAGERIFNLKRMLNVVRGISRKDDTLPPRMQTLALEGGRKGNLPCLGVMLNEYYRVRRWSEEGLPTEEKLTELGLEECVPGLKPRRAVRR